MLVILALVLALCVLVALFTRGKKHIPPKRTRQQKQADELVTTILPVIDGKS